MDSLLRYPSQIYNNHGLQCFVLCFMAVFLIAIAVLVLEIAIGQAYRCGAVTAYNSMNHRMKGVGMAVVLVVRTAPDRCDSRTANILRVSSLVTTLS